MQIHKRNLVVFNTGLFLFLSTVYLHICFSLDADVSALDLERYFGLLSGMPMQNTVLMVAAFLVFRIQKISIYLVTLYTLLIFFKTFTVFLLTYDKLLLLLNFMYVLTSFNTVLMLSEELKKAVYRPRFKEGSLDVEDYKLIKAKIKVDNLEIEGVVTNLDEYGFIFKPTRHLGRIKGAVEFNINLGTHVFHGDANIVTSFQECLGLEVVKKEENATKLGWEDLYSIILKRNLFN